MTIESFISGCQLKFKRVRKVPKKNVTVWTKQEVAELKRLLKIHGCDFLMISEFMSKSRDQIKRKFKSFEKKDRNISNQIFRSYNADQNQQLLF